MGIRYRDLDVGAGVAGRSQGIGFDDNIEQSQEDVAVCLQFLQVRLQYVN